MRQILLGIFLFLLTMSACKTYESQAVKRNYAAMYNPSMSAIHPEFLVQIKDSTKALVRVRVLRDELLFSRANKENRLKAILNFECLVYADPAHTILIDSVKMTRDLYFGKRNTYLTILNVSILPNTQHYVRCIVGDNTTLKKIETKFTINNSEEFNGHRNYVSISPVINNTAKGEVHAFYDWIPDNYAVRLYCTAKKRGQSHYSSYVSKLWTELPAPLPAYMPKRDSIPTPTLEFTPMGSQPYLPASTGFYMFSSDTVVLNGVAKLKVGPNFPVFKTPADLIPPLVYLTTKKEFETLMNSSNKKLAVDEFWVASAKNYPKAKQLIRIYYNRAKYANIYFSSISEGWRTDRGMVFMLLGPPDKVQNTKAGEKWFYGTSPKLKLITFDFVQVDNAYTDNHFVVKPRTDYRGVWRNAMDAWQHGRVYNGDNPIKMAVYENNDDIR